MKSEQATFHSFVDSELMIHTLPKEEGRIVTASDTRATFKCVYNGDGNLTWKQINARLCIEDFPAERDLVQALLDEQKQDQEFSQLTPQQQAVWKRADRRNVC